MIELARALTDSAQKGWTDLWRTGCADFALGRLEETGPFAEAVVDSVQGA